MKNATLFGSIVLLAFAACVTLFTVHSYRTVDTAGLSPSEAAVAITEEFSD